MATRLVSLSTLAMVAACASSTTRPDSIASVELHTSDGPAPLEAAAVPDPAPEPPASAWDFYRERYDSDGDGRIVRAEYTRSEDAFRHLDANRNGAVSAEDFTKRWDGVPRTGAGRKFVYGEGGPGFGEPAPDFRLTTTTGEEIDLAQFRGEKPVVLVFGSFT